MDDGGDDRSPSPPSPAAYLPDELVLEILARLPAKSLRRFKSVSGQLLLRRVQPPRTGSPCRRRATPRGSSEPGTTPPTPRWGSTRHFHVFQLVEQEDPCYGFVEAVDIYSSGTGRWALHRSRWSGRCSIFFARQTATYLNGVLHLATIYNAVAVASVDVKGQSWKVTPAPRGVDDDGRGRVAQPQGRLLFVHDREEWVLKQRLSMVDLFGRTNSPRNREQRVAEFHPDRDSIIFYDGSRERLVSYDMKHGVMHATCSLEEQVPDKYDRRFSPYVPFYSRVSLLPSPN
ncbi:hypothetical protein C2845_PM06G12040 [Panicum miliaceum]|uniref:F-box domain-containing protein n=1 Tax=Panicum miliaceum TaxID=4540 RepID=A0A3L6R6E3_PANMI|nr:hypothetical protein C2845_PM06G12040 [Panicum miliaceum]